MKIINKIAIIFTMATMMVFMINLCNVNAASNDTKIKKIEVSPCINNLEQDADNDNVYRVSVNNSVSSVNVNVETNDPNAKVSIEGNSSLDVGTNKINITVTAPDGTSSTYIIYARRLSKEIAETTITPNVQTEEKKFDKPSEQGIQPASTDSDGNEKSNEVSNTTTNETSNLTEEGNITTQGLENETAKWESNQVDESTKNTIIIIVIVIALIAVMYSVTRKKNNYKKKH